MASHLARPSDAQIPSLPDQTAFIEKWFEWHRGYTYVTDEYGNQELRGLIGERLDQVPPGFLPRTTDELNADRSSHSSSQSNDSPSRDNTQYSDTLENHDIAEPAQLSPNRGSTGTDFVGSSLSTLDLPHQERSIWVSFATVISLREELQRIRTDIEQVMSGLQELGDTAENPREAVDFAGVLGNRIEEINNQLDGLQQTRISPPRPNTQNSAITPRGPPNTHHRVTTASLDRQSSQIESENIGEAIETAHGREAIARAQRDNAALAFQRLDSEVQAATRARRTLSRSENRHETVARVFGTPEEVERQGDNYESPVGGLFTRAYARYRAAEAAREEEITQRPGDQAHINNRVQRRSQQVGRRHRVVAEARQIDRSPGHVSPSTSISPLSIPQSTASTAHSRNPSGTANSYRPSVSSWSSPTLPSLSQSANPIMHNSSQGTTTPSYTPTVPTFRPAVHAYTPPPTTLPQNIRSAGHRQTQGSSSGLPQHLAQDATVLHDQRPPLFNNPSQQLGPQANTAAQARRPDLSWPANYQQSHFTEDFNSWRERQMAEEVAQDTNPMEWTRSPAFHGYNDGHPGVAPTINPSTTNTSTANHFTPSLPQHIGGIYHPTTYTNFGSPHHRPVPNAPPNFSTIAPDAQRMQIAASQAQRRIVGDPAPRIYTPMPSTLPGLLDSNPTTSGAFEHDQRVTGLESSRYHRTTRDTRSGDSTSDSGDTSNLVDRIRRRRNAVAGSIISLPHTYPARPSAAVEQSIASLRARRQAGTAAGHDEASEEQGPRGLDRNDGRPEPRSEADMMVNMECKICFSQLASVAVLPCGKQLLLHLIFGVLWGVLTNLISRALRDVQVVRGADGTEPQSGQNKAGGPAHLSDLSEASQAKGQSVWRCRSCLNARVLISAERRISLPDEAGHSLLAHAHRVRPLMQDL